MTAVKGRHQLTLFINVVCLAIMPYLSAFSFLQRAASSGLSDFQISLLFKVLT